MVKDVPTISQVDKLQHLLNCLEEEAAGRLRSLKVTGANFPVAWKMITKRYDDGKVRLSAHLSRLLSMPLTPLNTAKEIVQLLDSVNEAIRACTILDRPVGQWDDWLVEIVVSRLAPRLREDWEKFREGEQGHLQRTFNVFGSTSPHTRGRSWTRVYVNVRIHISKENQQGSPVRCPSDIHWPRLRFATNFHAGLWPLQREALHRVLPNLPLPQPLQENCCGEGRKAVQQLPTTRPLGDIMFIERTM